MRKALSTCLYLGELPFIPGTMGACPAVALFLLLQNCSPYQDVILAILLVAGIPFTVWLARWAQCTSGIDDPQWFVLDEFWGVLVAVLLLKGTSVYFIASAAFVASRFFDIVKPWPIRQVEKLPSGWGVVLDDVLAGIYANIAVRILLFFIGA